MSSRACETLCTSWRRQSRTSIVTWRPWETIPTSCGERSTGCSRPSGPSWSTAHNHSYVKLESYVKADGNTAPSEPGEGAPSLSHPLGTVMGDQGHAPASMDF